jgi:hypothetical protein
VAPQAHRPKQLLSLASLVLLVGGCAVTPLEFPVFEAPVTPVVVVGYFSGGRYLPKDPACFTEDANGLVTVCMDPPPMAMQFHVLDRLHGREVPSAMTVFTTSHWGMGGIHFGAQNPYLVLLATDLSAYVIPRYHLVGLAYDRNGKLVVPMESPTDSIWWLPCHASEGAQTVRFAKPKHRFQIDSRRSVRITRGLGVDTLRRSLADGPPPALEQGCEK